MKTIRFFAVIGACALAASCPALADSFVDANAPDLTASAINLTYSSGSLNASGVITAYSVNGANIDQSSTWNWNLSASISSSGYLSGGTVQVTDGADTLLSGSLVSGNAGSSWGYGAVSAGSGTSDIFQFSFSTISGSLASDYVKSGGVGSVIVDANYSSGDQTLAGVWEQDFTSYSQNITSVAIVSAPEPAIYPFCAFGTLSMIVIRRRYQSARKHSQS